MKFEPNQAIKVLMVGDDGSLRSPFRWDFQWDAPVEIDSIYIPGEWTVPVSPVLTRLGYHLTGNPSLWWGQPSLTAYLAEYRGKTDGDFAGDITRNLGPNVSMAVESCRLLRPLTSEELATFSVYVDGDHEVKDVSAFSSGTAKIRAYGRACVYAHDKSCVLAHDESVVYAYDDAEITAYGGGVTACKMGSHKGVVTRTRPLTS